MVQEKFQNIFFSVLKRGEKKLGKQVAPPSMCYSVVSDVPCELKLV